MSAKSQEFTVNNQGGGTRPQYQNTMQTLNRIQKELKAPKGQVNKFGGYRYRSCEDILEAVKPLLGSAVLTLSDDIIGEGGRVYVRATATLRDGNESTTVTAFAREADTKKGMDESQITGAASSYARKYALNGLFAIDDTKDADATNDHSTPAKATRPEPTPAQWDKIIDRLRAGGDIAGTINSAKAAFTFNKFQLQTLESYEPVN